MDQFTNETFRSDLEEFANHFLDERGFNHDGSFKTAIVKSEDVLDLEDNLSLEEADRLL